MESELRVGIIGPGSVARVHASQLRKMPGVELSVVCGPEAEAFAVEEGFASVASGIEAAIPRMDAAVICSPSQHHHRQALELLSAGIPVLVEFPACRSESEAIEIGEAGRGSYIACAHTSRYLEPFRLVQRAIEDGALGAIRSMHYVRHIPPRRRSWTDDALTHHAAHILDLLLHWFEVVAPVACLAQPVEEAQDLVLTALAGEGISVMIDISYTSHVPRLEMTIAGERYTAATDGFSFIRSSVRGLSAEFDPAIEFERAVFEQDRDFLAHRGTAWRDTVRLARLTDECRERMCLSICPRADSSMHLRPRDSS